ncbi:dihydropteroate synthase [Pragia fontium]|uniref:dihydropteroate synthase n=1 Tax=Pragia fontium TaxID=82985 RepID=UPI00064B6B5A|nr:dihydropteroate synthase [Pragia fontium]AKJ41071.1 dihydropteroate synthase [Pragia fontium]
MKLESKGLTLDLAYPQVMGILNVTPDSFSDGGRFRQIDNALRHANEMIQAGATIIDIGGESTRPGAAEVPLDEELERVIPVAEAIAKNFEVWVSIDTYKPEVMRESHRVGVHLINDIRALQEPGALDAAIETGLPVCLMHMQGMPRTMQHEPKYHDVVVEVDAFFSEHIARCVNAGMDKNKILLDPGFGFGKDLKHNYQLLAHLSEFHHFGLPLLVGMSRKAMIGQLLNVSPDQRVIGSVACAIIAAMQGAQIIRVHDVKETAEAMRIVEATLSAKG